ncbi:hypothetical protein RB195_018195 [Necator americanus]
MLSGVTCEDLILVQTVFRHGDRAPIGGSTSPESRAYYFRGKEHLTNKGLDQARELGLSLKRRYADIGLLDARYIPSEVMFRSSPSERCLMTASAVASAIFNETETGQPTFVPVFTAPRDKEFVCLPRIHCPLVLREMMQKLRVEGATWNLGDLLAELFEQESKRMNYTHVVGDRLKIFEPLFLEYESGLAVPQWFNDDARKEADHLLDLTVEFMSGVGQFHSRKWIHTRSGKLLATILKNMQKTTKQEPTGKKFLAYSTHDVTISALLESMGILKDALAPHALAPQGRPAFTATVVFELWRNDTQNYVKVFYRRGPGTDEYNELTHSVNGCKNTQYCLLELFSKSVEKFSNDHPELLCPSHHENSSCKCEIEPTTIIFMVTTGLFALLFFVALFFLMHRRNHVNPNTDALESSK